MSLARIAARQGTHAVAVALDTDPRHGAEYVAELDHAWRHRAQPTDAERTWLDARTHLPFELAEELYELAKTHRLYSAGQALADAIASRYPNVS